MKATIPPIRRPNSGLTLRNRLWSARYTLDGRQVFKALGTDSLKEARERRDDLYHALRKEHTVVKAAGRGFTRKEKENLYLHRRRYGWQVLVRGQYLGHFGTREAAVAARDGFLGKQLDRPPAKG